MSICPNCKNQIQDNTNFCTNCGAQLIDSSKWESETVIQLTPEQNPNVPNNPYGQQEPYQQPYGQEQYQPYQQPYDQNPYGYGQNQPQKKSGLKGWQIGLIIGGVVLALILIVVLIVCLAMPSRSSYDVYDDTYDYYDDSYDDFAYADDYDDYDDYDNDDYDYDDHNYDDSYASIKEYARGCVENGVYKNDNMGIYFYIGDSYADLDAATVASFENEYSFCDFAMYDTLTLEQVYILFEDLSSYIIDYTAEAYMTSTLNGLESSLSSSGITIDSTDYSYNVIAGKTYYTAKVTLSNGIIEYFSSNVTDDIATAILIITTDDASFSALTEKFTDKY